MIYAPTDEFEMGSDASDSDADDDEFPQHSATLDGFWIDQTDVTNVQYRRCVEAGACQAPTCEWGWSTYEHAEHANHPVLCVDWYGAAAYCEWTGARLPTEAEWEYAARGPDSFIYPWGNSPPDSTLLNYAGNVGDTAEVGSYPGGASWCEALDMAGNVWEWVADWCGNHPSEPQTNPTGQPAGKDKLCAVAATPTLIEHSVPPTDVPTHQTFAYPLWGFAVRASQEGEPLKALRDADDADGAMLSAISAGFSVFSDSREQE